MNNTKILMITSTIVMGTIGIVLTFLAAEVVNYFGASANSPREMILITQIAGALYFGFAMINWTAKDNLIGGIYSRPVAIGNVCHFFIGAMALMKGGSLLLLPLTIIYSILATAFFIVLMTHPVKVQA
jgi:hypothetical protein